jgi:hypothetical protein
MGTAPRCWLKACGKQETGVAGGSNGSEQAQSSGGHVITAYYSSVLDQPVKTVWSLIRDFNNYPAYIDGVTESMIEDDKRGDEVGAVRCFNYGGNWIKQRLVRHSDDQRLLSYAGLDRFAFPSGQIANPPSPAGYEGTMHVQRIVDGERTFIVWSVDIDTAPGEEEPWLTLFQSWIPEWTDSLRRALARH